MKWKKTMAMLMVSALVSSSFLSSASEDSLANPETGKGRTDFITSDVDMDEQLQRDYTDNVPLGYSEDLFSLYQPGWGFDRPDVYRTGISSGFGMPVTVTANQIPVSVTDARFTPSLVTSESLPEQPENPDPVKSELNHAAGASRTGFPLAEASFSQETWGASLEYAFDGDSAFSANQGWNTYRQPGDYESSPIPSEGDWITLTFDEAKETDALAIYVYSDGGNTLPPKTVRIQYLSGQGWTEVNYTERPVDYCSGKNMIAFDPVKSEKYKITFTEQPGKCVSLNELALIQTVLTEPHKVSVKGQKYLSPDNLLVSVLEAENLGENPALVEISASAPAGLSWEEDTALGTLAGFEARLQGDSEFQKAGSKLKKSILLEPGQKEAFRVALSLSKTPEENEEKISRFLSDPAPGETQKLRFLEWFRDNIPYLDVPDKSLEQIYYFRWYTYRNHIRKTTDDSYIISEFLPNVPWAGKHNSINCPAGLHVAEGRWLQNSRYLDDYLTHWLDNGGAVRSYSFWIADAYYNRYLATGDPFVLNYVEKLKANFEAWDDHYNPELGLYWQYNDRDGMENSISSAFGYRPTINSYMYGDARALARLCALAKDREGELLYTQKADRLKEQFDSKTWDKEDTFYKVIACAQDGTLTNGEELQSVREQIGYIPWMFHLPDDDAEHSSAWRYLMDENYFLAPYGLLTAEKSYARITPEGEYGTGICRWDGPVWPFATSQTLTGMANLLNDYHQEFVTEEDYFYLLNNYAKAQYKNGAPWIAENLDGYSGRWIADERRSPNYNHSSFNDLVISGLFGIRPEEGDTLTLNPLIPEGAWDYFCLENVPYHGKNITLLYDKTGDVYKAGTGFQVYVDGRLAYHSQTPQKASVSLKEAPEKAEASLERLELTPPSKTVYTVGESFRADGMRVTAVYSDHSRRELSPGTYRVSGFSSSTAGRRTVTVSYSENGTQREAAFTVAITASVQKTAAKNYWNSITGLKANNYTKQSWTAFSNTKKALERLLNSPDASQAQLDKALSDLVKAKNGLKKTVHKGSSYQHKGLIYQITKVSGKTATALAAGAAQKTVKKVSIPKSVTINGVTCVVSKIGKDAFKNCKKLERVTIGANVKEIGQNAFANCKRLKKIVVKSRKVKSVRKHAFRKIHKKAVLQVPKAKVQAYKKLFLGKGQNKSVRIR